MVMAFWERMERVARVRSNIDVRKLVFDCGCSAVEGRLDRAGLVSLLCWDLWTWTQLYHGYTSINLGKEYSRFPAVFEENLGLLELKR